MLQTKQMHVLYTAEKAEKLYSGMSAVADENETMADGVTGLVNQMYSLRGRLKNKLGTLTPRERRYGKKVIALLDGLIEKNEKIQGKLGVSANTIRCTAYSLQVTVLKAIHYQWREKVYMSVMEGKDTFPAEDEHNCVLGRWYHSEGRKSFGSLPAFLRLGEAHGKLHQALSELVQESSREKRTPERILTKLDVLETVSQAVITALDELDDCVIR
ncbi:TPA: CZB domain-containing protein, partial [Salmonella enterica subsp. enterica serovar Poona]